MMEAEARDTDKAALALHSNGPITNSGILDYLVQPDRVLVAIHYANVPSFDHDHQAYASNGKTAIKFLSRFAKSHPPVCAHYDHLDGEAYVGHLSGDCSLLVARDGAVIDELDATPGEDVETDYDGEDVLFLKAVAIDNPVKITEEDSSILFESSRFNRGKAFHPWDGKRDILVDIIDGRDGPLTARSMPWRLAEKLSEEYLRRELVPEFAKQADGRGGRKTIDLVGYDANGGVAVTQTTTETGAKKVREKAHKLREYVEAKPDRYGYMFALDDTRPAFINGHPDIEFVSVETLLAYGREHPAIKHLI